MVSTLIIFIWEVTSNTFATIYIKEIKKCNINVTQLYIVHKIIQSRSYEYRKFLVWA